MDEPAALRKALAFPPDLPPEGESLMTVTTVSVQNYLTIQAVAREYLRLMTPPARCDVCDGKGWLDTYEPCGSCHGGWVGEARWHCTVRTGIQVCNPDRTGGGHHGCGWYVPIVHR